MFQLIPNVKIEKKIPKKRASTIARDLAIEQGSKMYVTGLPCKRGHVCGRYVLTNNCKQCLDDFKKLHRDRYKYGITNEQYAKMLEKQDNKCAICNQKESTLDGKTKLPKKMSIDHCHKTKKIRGLLCNNCNQGIGKFKHNSEWLRNAALYCEAI